MSNRLKTTWLAVAVIPALASCVSTPPKHTAEAQVEVPSAWTASITSSGQPSDRWWEDFGSAELTAVVEEALAQNHDLRIAAARLDAAVAEARIAGASLTPSLGFAFDGQRVQRNFIGFPIPGAPEKVLTTRSTTYGIALNSSWELDLWGRVRSGKRAALARIFHTHFRSAGFQPAVSRVSNP